MKRIACLSTIHSPDDEGSSTSNHLVEVFNSGRVFNKEHGVTGVFLVAGNSLLQVLEGEMEAVSRLLYQHSRDPWIKDVSVIANYATEKRVFPSWTIRFVKNGAENRQAFLDKLGRLLAKHIEFKSNKDQQRLGYYFNLEVLSGRESPPQSSSGNIVDFQKAVGIPDYSGKVLGLLSWPKPNQIRFSPELMKLCSRLVGTPTPYEQLNDMEFYASEVALQTQLGALERFGLLVVKGPGEPTQKQVSNGSHSPMPVKRSTGDRFSQVLKRFIASAKN